VIEPNVANDSEGKGEFIEQLFLLFNITVFL
jgi:hypothetical protein